MYKVEGLGYGESSLFLFPQLLWVGVGVGSPREQRGTLPSPTTAWRLPFDPLSLLGPQQEGGQGEMDPPAWILPLRPPTLLSASGEGEASGRR